MEVNEHILPLSSSSIKAVTSVVTLDGDEEPENFSKNLMVSQGVKRGTLALY